MSVVLDKQALDNIKNYRYKTHGLTPVETYLLEPFWNLVCNNSPDWLAPNMMTISGLIFPLL